MQYKINTIINLVDHAILLSDSRFHDTNIKIGDILSNNSFLKDLINKHVTRRLTLLRERSSSLDYNASKLSQNGRKDTIVIPVFKSFSDDIHRFLKNKFNIVYSVVKKLDCIVKKGKNKLQKCKETGIVYRLNCNNCESVYIGQTKRHLKTRINEHRTKY